MSGTAGSGAARSGAAGSEDAGSGAAGWEHDRGATRRVLAVRLDSDGDVLLTGPAVLALGTGADGAPREVDLLVSPQGRAAAHLLPGVAEVRVEQVPWSGYAPAAADPAALQALVAWMAGRAHEEVVVFTSFHQSPLPMALLARLAGAPRVVGTSEDYPGSLLDVRHRRPGGADGSGGGHEVLAALDLVAATGRAVPSRPRLAVRTDLVDAAERALPAPPSGARGLVVLHPGASVPARAPSPAVAADAAAALVDDGWAVALTGSPAEAPLVEDVRERASRAADPGAGGRAEGTGAGGRAEGTEAGGLLVDLAGATDLAGLAALLRRADAVVVGNTGPAHLAAAVGTPVVSLFSPVVPAERWAPWGVPTVLLGDQGAPCALSRARECPVPGHPCLQLDGRNVVEAVRSVVGVQPGGAAGSVERVAGSSAAGTRGGARP
ncbi:glycosyltransferase family 9 protein [uncultured Pseudokineococcus sp.]|uniref:glycosyltransferase family 9 protein n=1 Tax=uncultured Pseudokineococcus sp. TaxID=1642928 RepID=UPI002622992D|nr:glycosyltransferase family 9 protein [uncultured Pseudokineococcus sp.]